jgi:integrase
MATIRQRGNRFQAIVRLKRAGQLIYEEAKTFPREALARAWAKQLEQSLRRDGVEARRERRSGGTGTLGELIKRYIEYVDPIQPLGRSKRAVLEAIAEEPIAGKRLGDLQAEDVIRYARGRHQAGAGPATVAQDLIYLRLVLAMARPTWGIEMSAAPVDEALPLLKQWGVVGRSEKRERRPSAEELRRLYELFRKQVGHPSTKIPMLDLCEYAIWTGRRESEICRVRWEDLDLSGPVATQLLRDMKHPRKTKGNDFRFPLLGEARAIVERQPRIDERIFPYEAESVSARFTNACAKLGIKDLHFHDLRREAASRLFEEGYVPHEVAQVTGHKSLDTLWQIYTKLDPAKLDASRARREARERKRPARRLRVVR